MSAFVGAVVYPLMCGSPILGSSSVVKPGFKDGRCNWRVVCRCVWRDRPESQGIIWHSRRGIDSYLQMSSHHQSVIFPLPHTGARSQSLKKRSTMSVNNALAGHQNQETLCPSMEILACQRVINSQIKPTSRRAGIIQESGKELWTQHHSSSLMGEGMFVESWPQKQE